MPKGPADVSRGCQLPSGTKGGRTGLSSLQARSLNPGLAGTQAVIQNGIGVDKFDPKQEPKSM